jgi:hypothetical protein
MEHSAQGQACCSASASPSVKSGIACLYAAILEQVCVHLCVRLGIHAAWACGLLFPYWTSSSKNNQAKAKLVEANRSALQHPLKPTVSTG